jgi:hypothetical protein
VCGHLAVRGQGHFGDDDDGGRHHVVRQQPAHVAADGVGQGCGIGSGCGV